MKICLAVFLLLAFRPVLPAQDAMQMDAAVMDLGDVSEDDGPQQVTFSFTNISKDTLQILQLMTTCGCIKSSWSAVPVLPGEESSFSLVFEPMGRPGRVDNPAYVYYRAGDCKLMKEVRIKGMVGHSSDRFIRYAYRCGDLRLMQDKVRMGDISRTQRRKSVIAAGNSGDYPVYVSADKLPAYMEFECVPDVILPGETADLVFYMDGGKAPEGDVVKKVALDVSGNGKKQEMSVTVYAHIIDR